MKKLTYSETNGRDFFNWKEALSVKKISDDTWEELRAKAGSWVTCACGNQCAIIPREINGRPKDVILQVLGGAGMGFCGAISRQDKEEALHLLEMIELRSAYLIKEINKNLEETN